ncbi:hypothetical protein J8F10_30040 [Gemmata sp. G18]|uniref:Uncharacterized protein n=1 Tax=Gemmata palustris TaxID=2822762 RepID=A0ABS5C0I9_9BACT|nr:hypothetical protein [Gemmata palustris]MBP3959506.1 hypothetical protein [Gemmata palustris]
MTRVDPTRVRWPVPWRPLTDENEALAFGRAMSPNVAPTVLAELRREVCDRHPLAGAACRPIAWESWSKKDFLFLTDRPGLPVVLVHFTWHVEPNPEWPFVVGYSSLRDFFRRERSWAAEARVCLQRGWADFIGGW